MKKISCMVLAVVMMLLIISGCGSKSKTEVTQASASNEQTQVNQNATSDAAENSDNNELEYTKLSQLDGKKIGTQTGSIFDLLAEGLINDAQYSYFNNISDEITALKNGKVEAVPTDEPVARLAVAKNSDLGILPECLAEDHYTAVLKKGSPLTQQFNDIIAQLREDGTLDKLKEKWTGSDESVKTIQKKEYTGANGNLVVAAETAMEPMVYIGNDGEILGYEAELIQIIAEKLGYNVEFKIMDFSALIPSIQSGKADVAMGTISITEERRKSVDLCDSWYDGGAYFVVRKAVNGATAQNGFLDSLKASFTRTFITEGRWKLVLGGLWVTVYISVLSGIVGSLFGFGLCMLRRSKNRIGSSVTAAFIRLIQGTPIVVLLMILYYVIFGKVDISAAFVAILGFAINFGVYAAEIMRTGIDAVDKGQIEASYALGFTKVQTFAKITFPQAAKHFLPVFKGEFISMVKMTSVVGYIAIQDLTKVSDIIRSRTLEAFFPLIATAIIYFIIANLMTMLLSRIELKLDPKHRKLNIKGVEVK